MAVPEYARLNTGGSITRGNSGNGALPTPELERGENTNNGAKDGYASKSVTAWRYERALRHQPKRASSIMFEISSNSKNRRKNLPGYAAWEIHPVMKIELD